MANASRQHQREKELNVLSDNGLNPFDGFVITFHAESRKTIAAGFSRERVATVRLALADVGNVNFSNLDADGTDAVGDGDGSVSVGSRIHDHSIENSIGFLQFVDNGAFVVCLKVIDFVLRKTLLEMLKMRLK